MAAGGLDDAAHLVARGHVVVDLLEDFPAGVVGGVVGLAERGLFTFFQLLVDRLQAGARDGLADGPGDGLRAVDERLVLRLSLADEPGVEALGDAMDRAEQDSAFTEDVGLVLALERGLEGVRRAEPDRPGERVVGGAAVDVLMDRERAVDPGTVDLAALFVEPAHRRTHPLRTDRDHVDVVRKVLAGRLQVREQEAVREAKRGAGPERVEDAPVVLREGGVGDEQQRHVGFVDDRVHLAEGAVGFRETDRLGFLHR